MICLGSPRHRHLDQSGSRPHRESRNGEIHAFLPLLLPLFLQLRLLLPDSLPHNQRIVISTEAAHAFVSSAAEKSASLPQLRHHHALIVVPAFCL
jgi:hypothetical protein